MSWTALFERAAESTSSVDVTDVERALARRRADATADGATADDDAGGGDS